MEKQSIIEAGPPPDTEWTCPNGHKWPTWEVGPISMLPEKECTMCGKIMTPRRLEPLISGGPPPNPNIRH